MIKKVVIFAAGRGTRMKELSQNRPKHLIEIFGRPFLYYLLSNLKQAGFSEFIMVSGYLSEQIDNFCRHHQKEFPQFRIINQFELLGDDKYGTLLPLLAAREAVAGDNFVVVMGDNLYSLSDLDNFRKRSDNFCYVGGHSVPNPEKYGVLVSGENDLLLRIDERCPQPVSNLINSGLYKFTNDIYKAAEKVSLSPRGEYEITDAITLLSAQERVKIIKQQDYWLDFGQPEDVGKLEKFIKVNNLFATYGIKEQ